MKNKNVKVWTEKITIPTYLPAQPDKNPMFLDKRVYQGSNGKIYPLPFTDRISETATDYEWQAIYIENQYLQVMILPEIGGRIHAILDKISGYDLIYRQEVIKPALVGLAGSWISGGIEFNWAQHHRPATFLPVDYVTEQREDGSAIVWLGDHEPMTRMKGMHGVCLYPDKAFVELKVQVYNRTPLTQTFLWWANAATKVHEGYQSFFPPDVYYIADHAKRAMSEYPFCEGSYYGIDYLARAENGVPFDEIPPKFVPPNCGVSTEKGRASSKLENYAANDLSWYANIPVPTSYMCMGSEEDFFGGYDHFAEAGIVHVADHHIAPGKKQWTWGNHEFGYAWDRNLSDDAAPYIELMAGVYTDNQPDFSFLHPFETKSWSQYWYGINKIGVPKQANTNAAVHLKIDKKTIKIGISATSVFEDATIRLTRKKDQLEWQFDLKPENPFLIEIKNEKKYAEKEITLSVLSTDGKEIIVYRPKEITKKEVPPPATEPSLPEEIESIEELYLTGLHLEQYRHATRQPEIYWLEALKREPYDSRCNNALGLWYLRRGEFKVAEAYFRAAIERLTKRNPNPLDGEPYYNLGLCLCFQADSYHDAQESESLRDAAYSAFYKAAWNEPLAAAAFLALAEMDCRQKNWGAALKHLDKSLFTNAGNLRARNLKVMVMRRLNRRTEASSLLKETLDYDPLDWLARYLSGERLKCDLQTALDLAHNTAQAGFFSDAIEILESREWRNSTPMTRNLGAVTLIDYTIGWFYQKLSAPDKAKEYFDRAALQSPDYCFPSRLKEINIFETARRSNPQDPRAPYYLGNLFYDRRRHLEAIKCWEESVKIEPTYSVVWRNLGIAYFNRLKNTKKAVRAYDKAFRANSKDARLLYERDQLWKRIGEIPKKRLRELEKFPDLIVSRDDLSVELCALYNQTNQPHKALKILESRNFQPWEGGEGQVLNQHVQTHLSLGKSALKNDDAISAKSYFEKALSAPKNLGEAKHLLANQSDIYYWLGVAAEKLGDSEEGAGYWRKSTNFKGDFQEMSVREFSEMTFYSALSLQKLEQTDDAEKLLKELSKHAKKLHKTTAKIDYFATSLPTMLLFDDDLQQRNETAATFLQAQAKYGLGKRKAAKKLLKAVISKDPNHFPAADFLETFF